MVKINEEWKARDGSKFKNFQDMVDWNNILKAEERERNRPSETTKKKRLHSSKTMDWIRMMEDSDDC